MTKKSRVKREIIEVLSNTDELLDAIQIKKAIKRLRITKALNELHAEGKIAWDKKAQGWFSLEGVDILDKNVKGDDNE